jgi:ubiquinone biosynthesis monooxygenase Coq7
MLVDSRRLAQPNQKTLADRLIGRLDRILRVVLPVETGSSKASPVATCPDPHLNTKQMRHSAALIRVNHSGEVCAQALYVGQSITARSPELQESLQKAALEEREHLHWCAERLDELKARPSLLNPLWMTGSLAIGVTAGLFGDGVSLGFVEETERQVCHHLDGHLAKLCPEDLRSRAILTTMLADEARHADNAVRSGAQRLPGPVKYLMKIHAKLMTKSSYWI